MASRLLLASVAALLTAACAGSADSAVDTVAASGATAAAAAATPVANVSNVANAQEAGVTVATLPDSLRKLVVYKRPNCGCCGAWIDHVKHAGFEVEVHDAEDLTPVKMKHGISSDLESCHTTTVGQYAIEGHVPAGDIVRLLTSKPNITGIAVPGMPAGSPGMEQGDYKEAYEVIAFDRNGARSVFAKH